MVGLLKYLNMLKSLQDEGMSRDVPRKSLAGKSRIPDFFLSNS